MTAEKKLGFGIIGCGLIANWHAKAVMEVQGASLIGATDKNADALSEFTDKYNIKAFETVDDLINNEKIDIVCICTPSGLHAPLALQAANAGKHVVVEKPMALNLMQADDILAACEKNNVKMAVISQSRFSPAVCKLKKTVDSGLLGNLVLGNVFIKYYRSQEYYNKGGWRGTWEMDGGGALMNQGIHGIDLLQYIMGPVKSVTAHTKTLARSIEVEDTAAALLEFQSGAIGVIEGATSIYPGAPRRLEICGDKGTIVLEEDNIVKWDIEGQELPDDVEIGDAVSKAANDPAGIKLDGHILQIRDMVDSVNNGKQPFVHQYEGRKPLEIIMAVYESSKTGQTVTLH